MSLQARRNQKVTPHVAPTGRNQASTFVGPADPERPYQSLRGHDPVTARQVGVPAKQVLQRDLVEGAEEAALREQFEWARGE